MKKLILTFYFLLSTFYFASAQIPATTPTKFQPLDPDLTAIAALTGTNTIYYRSAADTWGPITIGSNLTFSGGTLSGSTGLPSQTGNSGKYLTTNGTAASWATIDLSSYQTKAGVLALGGFSSVTGTLPVANGGTGITSFGSGIATWLGTPSVANLKLALSDETTVVGNLLSLANPSTISFIKIAADNTVSTRTPAEVLTDIGAQPLSTMKVYRALLTQTGSNAPVATVLENSLGGTVAWSYAGAGDYRATLAAAFTTNKTFLRMVNPNASGPVSTVLISQNACGILVGGGDDDFLDLAPIEILVYP